MNDTSGRNKNMSDSAFETPSKCPTCGAEYAPLVKFPAELVQRVEEAIASAAYPDAHPDFTDAGWRRMAEAAIACCGPK
jgi:hypothetical protein